VPADRNLARLAEDAFERHGDYESLWFEGRWHRSGELRERAARVASGLSGLGVGPGDRVVVFAANSPEVSLVYNAVWRAGAVVTPAIFLLPPPELRHILEDSEARLVVASPEFAEAARAVADVPVVSTEELPEGREAPIVARRDDDLAALMYTGGTTGRAKGVMLSHASLWEVGKAAHDAGHVSGIVRSLVPLPLSHSYGLLVTVVGLHAPEPGVSVLMRWFEPARFLELVQEHAVQISAVVPSMLQLLLAQPLEDYDLSSLRYLACGAAPLPRDAIGDLERRLPHVELREGYGLTETSALVSTNPPGRIRIGSVGPPVPGCELRIVDDDDRELPAGEVGEICCRSPFLMEGYWRAPELTAEAMRGGWFHTGDLGRLDDEGYLYVLDRRDDLIVSGGENIYPAEVEAVLLAHPAVADAGVVCMPHPAWGQVPIAVVQRHSGAAVTEEALIADPASAGRESQLRRRQPGSRSARRGRSTGRGPALARSPDSGPTGGTSSRRPGS
jgi:long-chain acyl-CoA synthetase